MAYSPIAFTAPNYRDYNNWWLKAYEPGTTTPKSGGMATDSALTTFIAKAQLNADGFIISAGGALIIPYIDGTYDLWLFPTEAEADANDTSNALRLADKVTGVNGDLIANMVAYNFNTLEAWQNETDETIVFSGSVALLKERTTGDGGGFVGDVIAGTGSANGIDIVAHNTLSFSLEVRDKNGISTDKLGTTTDGVTDYSAIFDRARNISTDSVEVPVGVYNVSDSVDFTGSKFHSYGDVTILNNTTLKVKNLLDDEDSASSAYSRSKQLMWTNMYLQNNFGQGVVNLGDSISHGAYSGNAYTNQWNYLLQRSINAEFGSSNLGLIPMEGLYNVIPSLDTPQIHDVTFSAGWGATSPNPAPYDYPLGKVAAAAAEIVNGKSYESSTTGSTVTVVVPTMQERMYFLYTQQPAGGVFNVTINGVAAADIDTSGALSYNETSAAYTLVDDGSGKCTVVLTKADANITEINAVINYNSGSIAATELAERMTLRNYSQAGRQLYHMTENAIIRACNCSCLIMSLGYNDWDPTSGDTDNNQTNFDAFKQRIDWLIQYCKVYKNLVVVQDFIWYASLENSRTRRELKRLADECNGIYLGYADDFFSDGTLPVSGQLNTPLFLWADDAHPNALGNELIFSRLSTAMGLSVNSKTIALEHHDYAFPLEVLTGYKNRNTIPSFVSTIQRNGNAFDLSIDLAPNAGNFPDGALTPIVGNLPAKFGEAGNVRPRTVPTGFNLASGANILYTTIENNFNFSFYANTTISDRLEGSFVLATIT